MSRFCPLLQPPSGPWTLDFAAVPFYVPETLGVQLIGPCTILKRLRYQLTIQTLFRQRCQAWKRMKTHPSSRIIQGAEVRLYFFFVIFRQKANQPFFFVPLKKDHYVDPSSMINGVAPGGIVVNSVDEVPPPPYTSVSGGAPMVACRVCQVGQQSHVTFQTSSEKNKNGCILC